MRKYTKLLDPTTLPGGPLLLTYQPLAGLSGKKVQKVDGVQAEIPTVEAASTIQSVVRSWFDDQKLQALLDDVTHSRQVPGNSVRILKNGAASQAARLANIEEADVVFLKTYNFREDETGAEMKQALMDRLKDNKPVFVQYDLKGYYSKSPLKLVFSALRDRLPIPEDLRALQEAGAVLMPTNVDSPNPIFGKDHEKYLLTYKKGESAKLIMGGMNVGDEWAFGGDPNRTCPSLHGHHGFRDTDFEISGPVVEDALKEFVADAERARKRHERLDNPTYSAKSHQALNREVDAILRDDQALAPTGSARMRFVANKPFTKGKEKGQYIEKLYCTLLEHVPAGETVTFFNPFFLPPPALIKSMKAAAQRGVKFRCIFNPPDSIEKGMAIVAVGAQSLYRDLFKSCPEGSMEIYEWHGEKAPELGTSIIHHKLAQFGDNGPCLGGSCNMDYHSLRHNTEGVMLMDSKDCCGDFARMLDEDVMSRAAVRITPEDANNYSMAQKAKQWAVRHIFKYII